MYNQYFGDDLLQRLVALGFAGVSLRLAFPEFRIAEQTTIVAEKRPYVRMAPAVISDRAWS